MRIVYVTGNSKKFEAAKHGLEESDVELVQKVIDLPEIQSSSVEEVAKYKAKYAAELLGEAVVVTDGGAYFKALRGFPGPFLKFINEWFEADDFIRLLDGKEDRSIDHVECLAYCEPGKDPVSFIATIKGHVALTPGKAGWNAYNQIFIFDGYDKPSSEMDEDAVLRILGKGLNWDKLKEYLLSK